MPADRLAGSVRDGVIDVNFANLHLNARRHAVMVFNTSFQSQRPA
jgi:hypothetical protein